MAINQTCASTYYSFKFTTITEEEDRRAIWCTSIQGEVTDRPEDMAERVQAKYAPQLAAEGKKVDKVVHAMNLKEWYADALDGWIRVRYSVTEL